MAFLGEENVLVADYQNLIARVEEIRKQDVGYDAVKRVSAVMDDAEVLVNNVNKPREIGLDAKVLELSSVVVHQNSERFDSVFRPLEFADKLVNMLSSKTYEASQSEASIWTRFSEDFGYLLPLRPSFDYINGTYDRAGFKPKERAVRQCQRRKDCSKEVVKTLSEKGLGKDDNVLGQRETLDMILKMLLRIYKKGGNKPIHYFKFILNPDSFEETCQNILCTAFLVRDFFLKMYMLEGELVMVPISEKENMASVKREESRRQFVIQMDRKDWKDLVEVYNVTEPMMNLASIPRKNATDFNKISKEKKDGF